MLRCVSLATGWLIPIIGFLVAIAGAIISVLGAFKQDDKLSRTGVAISFAGIIISILAFAYWAEVNSGSTSF